MRPRSQSPPRGFRHLSVDRGAAARSACAQAIGEGIDPAHHVGPLPNLAAALKAIEVDAPTTTASVTNGDVTR